MCVCVLKNNEGNSYGLPIEYSYLLQFFLPLPFFGPPKFLTSFMDEPLLLQKLENVLFTN